MSTHHVIVVLVAAIVAFALGALWYSPPLFARAWVKAQGHTPEKLAAMQASAGKTYGISFLCFILMAAVVCVLLAHLGVTDWMMGAMWGAHLWLGIAVPIGLMANVYSDKPLMAWVIDAGYQLLYLVVMGAIIGAWQ
jgi:uncharacterized protein DUF1761